MLLLVQDIELMHPEMFQSNSTCMLSFCTSACIGHNIVVSAFAAHCQLVTPVSCFAHMFWCANLTCCDACLQFPLCLSLLEEGKIQTGPMITHRLGFSEADVLKGFKIAAASATTGAIKVMFSL